MADTFKGIITADGKKRTFAREGITPEYVSDKTLSVDGAFADAKVVGNNFKKTKTETDSLKEDLAAETSRATAVEDTKADKTALARTNRSLDALWKLNQGISYEFQKDEAVTYQKNIPTGAKMASVEKIGGRTLVWNQLVKHIENSAINNVSINTDEKGTFTLNGTSSAVIYLKLNDEKESIIGHKYYISQKRYPVNSDAYIYNDGGGITLASAKSAIQTATLEKNFYLRCDSDTTFDNVVLKPIIFDLTQMFGSGNEPSTPEEFETMFPADYYPYNAGELMSAPVNEVVEQGKNLLNYDAWKGLPITRGTAVFEKNSFTLTATENDCYTEPTPGQGFPDDAKIEINEGETVTLSWESSADTDGNIYIFPNGVTDGLVYTNNHNTKTLTYTATRGVKFITFRFGVTYAGNTVSYKNIQIEKKIKATSYEPYHSTTHAIPQPILQLDGYGDGVTDNVYNYVDWENKKYHKRVGKVDLGTVNDFILGKPLNDGSGNVFYFTGRELGFKKNGKAISNKLIYSIPLSGQWEDLKLNETYIDSGCYVVVAHNVSTLDEFKQAMSGVILYYELAEEQITDISDLIGDTLQEPIEVEAGGSLTFQNTHGANYRVPVPSTVEYTVKLSEVAK